ncbi:MAG: PH domain-containing protein [Clostridiales bacterium]|nr:PH domain-containing protein [Clostridiales bacterium]
MFNTPTRNHISVIVERLKIVFIVLIIVTLNILAESDSDIFNPEYWRALAATAEGVQDYVFALSGLGFAAVCGIVIFISFLFWRKTYFYIDGSNLIYEKRTIFKKFSKLAIVNISTVNIERSVFERLIGTSKVKLDLNSAETSEQTDFTFFLKAPLALALQAEINGKKQGLLNVEPSSLSGVNNLSGAAPATEQRRGLISFSTAQVIRHKLLTLPIIQGLVVVFSLLTPVFFEPDGAESLSSLPIALALTFGGGLIAVIYSCLNTLGYKVEMDSNSIYIDCGILKKTSYSFELSKINGVFLKRPLLARIFGLSSIEVAVVGFGNEKQEIPQLCLLVPNAKAQEILEICASDFLCEGVLHKSHKSAYIIGLIKLSVTGVLLTAAGVIVDNIYLRIGAAVVFVLAAVSAYLSCITKTIAYDGRILAYSRGIFSKQTSMFKYGDVQNTVVKTNPITEKLCSGKMVFYILSNMRQRLHFTGYFDLSIFDNIGKAVVNAKDTSSNK